MSQQPPDRYDKSDPSALTTSQLWREVAMLKELFETRVSAVEQSIRVAHEDLVRVPTDVQKQVGNLKELHEEKFRSLEQRIEDEAKLVQVQFKERDVRTDSSAKDSKLAIDAALQAAKEAVGKSEASTLKQIEASDEKIDDVKDRLTRREGSGSGMTTLWGIIVGAIILALALFAALRH